MPIRNRNGKLEWRFKVAGREYSQITNWADTPRNRIKVQRAEAKARELVMEGRGSELRLRHQPFNSAAEQFIVWAQGEYCEHPNSWKRLATSMTSLKVHFGKKPLSSVTAGEIEDYKSLRRKVHQVREVTLRHDLHALSVLFQYGQKHHWCKANPLAAGNIEIPSDAEAVRMHVLTPAEESRYFAAIEALREERLAGSQPWQARGFDDLRDLAILILNQGCRPEELREMEKDAVDLEAGCFTIRKGKSRAARRTLRLTAASRSVLAKRLQSPGRWLFPSHKAIGKHIGPCQRLHEAALKRAKLEFVPYDLRHTAATRWGEAGVDIATIAAWLGHANLRTVQKYIHPSKEHLDAAAERFEVAWLARGVVKESLTTEKERVN
jgi:integrase